MLGVEMKDEAALLERMKQAIVNSRKKKYHGNEKDMNELPTI